MVAFRPSLTYNVATHHFPACEHTPVVPPHETWLRLLAGSAPLLTCHETLQKRCPTVRWFGVMVREFLQEVLPLP